MKFLRAIAAMASPVDADELSPAAREACHRDQVWAERDHLANKLNADRRAAFEGLKDLLRLAPVRPSVKLIPIPVNQAHRAVAPSTLWYRDFRRKAS